MSRRLSRVNLRYGSEVVVNARTHKLLGDWAEVRPLEMVYDADKHVMSEVYELLGVSAGRTKQQVANRDLFWQGVIYYRAGQFGDAIKQFELARKNTPEEDGPLDYYIEATKVALGEVEGEKEDEHSALVDDGHARLINHL